MDAIVIGAGVVGLAVARALALNGLETLILDGESSFGTWTSSRNSEVIHAGIYYPVGSLKATLCVEGRDRLYAFCESHGVEHRRCGKLIFAHDTNQGPELDKILKTAEGAGVHDLRRLTGAEVSAMEPALRCAEALYSPSTGIIDSHGYMLALLGGAEANGAMLVCDSKVTAISRQGGDWAIHVNGDVDPSVTAPILVNSAGLTAHSIAGMIDDLNPDTIPPLHYARGVYFSYAGVSPFTRLIYPVPEPGGLGTHLTLDLAGQIRFGPDVEWNEGIDYTVDPGRHGKFAAAAQRIWPELDPLKLRPSFAGVRPKLSGPGEPAADFAILGEADHGTRGLLNLFGIESPGLTSSLAIAEMGLEKLGIRAATPLALVANG
jgi:L-2-hydroxyglutarate oxidase LhgO